VFLAFWSWDKGFIDKNHPRVFKSEHMKELGSFVQVGVWVKADWVGHFHDFAGATLTSTLLENTW
jgi:hypothetical protein